MYFKLNPPLVASPGQAVYMEQMSYMTHFCNRPYPGIVENEPPHDKTNKMTCVPSEDSDQPGNLPSLISLCCALNG